MTLGMLTIEGTWRDISAAPLARAVAMVVTVRTPADHVIPDEALNRILGLSRTSETDPDGLARVQVVKAPGVVYRVVFGGVVGHLRCDDWADGALVPFVGIKDVPGGDVEVDPLTWDAVLSGLAGRIAAQVSPVVEDYLTAHPPTGGGGGVTDHGALTGLDQDDHPQYLTAARGDARYVLPGSLAPVATAGDYASLTGTVPTSALPPLAINTVTVVATQAAMLALTAERGDMAIRTDTGRTYVLASDSPATLADWKEVTAAGQVVSVAGKSGAVTLTKADVGLGSVDDTSDADKPISTATAAAITALAPKVNPALTATTPAPVLTTVTTPALSGWTLTGSATYSGGTVTVGPADGSLSTDISVTDDTVYQIDLTTSASSGGDVTVTLGAASAVYPAAGITSVTVTATETGTRTLTISGATWSATITGVTVRELTRLSPAATIGAAEVRAWGTNTGIGSGAHRSLTTGSYNTAAGTSAQYSLTTGGSNTAAGTFAQYSLTTGSYNTAAGTFAQYSLTTGSYNTAAGTSAQYSLTTGSYNTAAGTFAQSSLTTGSNNTATGMSAQYSLTTGSYNTAAGTFAQRSLTTGSNNTAVGTYSLYSPASVTANASITGSRQTALGAETGQSVTTPLNDITTVGYRAVAGADFGTAIGSGAHAAHLRSVALGSTTTTTADDQIMVGARDVEITSATHGVILRSPNGTRYRVTVTDAGTLTVSAV